MPRLVWLTDIHLNFVPPPQVKEFLDEVAASRPDVVLLGGDISDARDVGNYLEQISERIAAPIYFVLGNHDFYYGSIRAVRQQATELCARRPNLHYLTSGGCFDLPRLGLVGHDGWADARLGDYERSLVMMNDYKLIAELAGANKLDRWPLLKQLGDEAAAHVRRVLPAALDRYPQAIFLTHVPPFEGATWHEGKLSDDEWLPHFSCQALGDALVEVMRNWPDRQLTVLCGHSHSPGEFRPLENIVVYTGGAQYGMPMVQRIIDAD